MERAAAFHAILSPADRLTDRRDRVPPTHPRPFWPTAARSPSLSALLSPGVLREEEKKIFFFKLQNQRLLKRERGGGGGGEKTQLCLCACVVRPAYDKLRRILKPHHGLGCRGAGYNPCSSPLPPGSPSPRHLLKERGPLRSRLLPAAALFAPSNTPRTCRRLNPNFPGWTLGLACPRPLPRGLLPWH